MLIPSALTFLINAAWQVGLIALTAALGGFLLQGALARTRHRLYTVALLASAIVPLISMALAAGAERSQAPPSSRLAATAAPGLELPSHLGTLLLVMALAAMAFRALQLGRAWRRTRASSGRKVDGLARALAQRSAQVLGVPRFELLSSTAAAGPFTVGTRIIVPERLLAAESSALFSAAIAHELAHVRRRDFALNLALELLMVPLAFHPGAWFLKRRVDDLCELACDELVVEAGLQEATSYAESLLDLAKSSMSGGALGFALGAVAPPLLDERIRVLVEPPAPPSASRATVSLATMVGVAALCTGFAVPATVRTDWLATGLAACRTQDFAEASEAVAHLDEYKRADLLFECASEHVVWCADRGFHLEETP